MAEPVFKPKPGQVDYTDIRYCPVFNCVITRKNKILVVRRSRDLRLYPGVWNGVSGFLDDKKSIEEKVEEELKEELSIDKSQITSIIRGKALIQEGEKYKKTWIVIPTRAEITTKEFSLDWEADKASWLTLQEVRKLDLLPGFDQVLEQFFQ